MRDRAPSAVRSSPAVPALEGGLNIGLGMTPVLQVAPHLACRISKAGKSIRCCHPEEEFNSGVDRAAPKFSPTSLIHIRSRRRATHPAGR
jgi:hypothetical protein